MFNFDDLLSACKGALKAIFVYVFAFGMAGLIGLGAYAVGSAVGQSNGVGMALGCVAALFLFLPLLAMLSTPDDCLGAIGNKALSIQKVFSGLI